MPGGRTRRSRARAGAYSSTQLQGMRREANGRGRCSSGTGACIDTKGQGSLADEEAPKRYYLEATHSEVLVLIKTKPTNPCSQPHSRRDQVTGQRAPGPRRKRSQRQVLQQRPLPQRSLPHGRSCRCATLRHRPHEHGNAVSHPGRRVLEKGEEGPAQGGCAREQALHEPGGWLGESGVGLRVAGRVNLQA